MSLRKFTTALMGALMFAFVLMSPVANAKDDHRDAFVYGPGDDNRMAREVRHKLLGLPWYGVFDDLAFRVDGGTVVLLGQVVRPSLKPDAERAVQHVEGVQRVINQIEVLPTSMNDDGIRRAEYRAIYGDSVLSVRYGFRAIPSIHIIVKNGHVTLEGVVANQADKNIVGIRAHEVPNVFSVTNNLAVES